jgi:hypothetical protein
MSGRVTIACTLVGLLCAPLRSFPQSSWQDSKIARESFYSLPEGILKEEISLFAIRGGSLADENKLTKSLLTIPLVNSNDSVAEFLRQGLFVRIERTAFSPVDYQPSGHDTANADLYLAKNHPFLGQSGDFPHTRISLIKVQLHGHEVVIPKLQYRLLLDPNFCLEDPRLNFRECYAFVYSSPDKRRIYLYMRNGDSSASYEVTWVIENGEFLRRVFDRLRE